MGLDKKLKMQWQLFVDHFGCALSVGFVTTSTLTKVAWSDLSVSRQIYQFLTYSSAIPCSSVTCSSYMVQHCVQTSGTVYCLKTDTSVVLFSEFGYSMLQNGILIKLEDATTFVFTQLDQ